MAIIFSKFLKETDIRKRLSVRSKNKKCFLDFGKQRRAEFKAVDEDGTPWLFVCTIRNKGPYPKPVLSKGWLQFVRCWRLAVDDQVILHDKQDGEDYYRIQVVKHSSSSSSSSSSSVHSQTHESYGNSNSNIQDIAVASHAVAEAQPISIFISNSGIDWVGSEFGREPHAQVSVREPKLIDFFALDLQQQAQSQRQRGQPSQAQVQVREPKLIDFFALETYKLKQATLSI